MNLTNEQLQAAKEGPVTVEEAGERYVVLSQAVYERLRRVIYDDSPLTPREEEAAFFEAGRIAGWDDPAMDIYNDLDPQKS